MNPVWPRAPGPAGGRARAAGGGPARAPRSAPARRPCPWSWSRCRRDPRPGGPGAARAGPPGGTRGLRPSARVRPSPRPAWRRGGSRGRRRARGTPASACRAGQAARQARGAGRQGTRPPRRGRQPSAEPAFTPPERKRKPFRQRNKIGVSAAQRVLRSGGKGGCQRGWGPRRRRRCSPSAGRPGACPGAAALGSGQGPRCWACGGGAGGRRRSRGRPARRWRSGRCSAWRGPCALAHREAAAACGSWLSALRCEGTRRHP